MSIEAGLCKYAELNDKIKQELRTKKKVTITAVNGQRYIGCALDAGKTIQVHGTPGNDMACYLNGGKVEVFGNCQDAVGNTMNGGEIVIHGHAGTLWLWYAGRPDLCGDQCGLPRRDPYEGV